MYSMSIRGHVCTYVCTYIGIYAFMQVIERSTYEHTYSIYVHTYT